VTAQTLPLRFQIGARTLASIPRRLVRVPLDLDDALAERLPALPPLDRGTHGYLVTSLPEAQRDALLAAARGMLAFERQLYPRHYADLTIGFDAYSERMSGNTRSQLKRKAKKVAAASGGTLDVRRYRSPDEMLAFHAAARDISVLTYQEKLLGSGLPDGADFVQRMLALAAAGQARGWILAVGGVPVAYLYCPIADGVVRYEYLGHDPAYNELSPGGVLQLEAMRDLYAEPGLRAFDFTEGDGQHKRQFATDGVACVDLLLLRPTLVNRAALGALAAFDGAVGAAKAATTRFGLQKLAKRVRRAG
jgi:CelD/BcsL family acetyltransferase involved in cellulose biosynthesis